MSEGENNPVVALAALLGWFEQRNVRPAIEITVTSAEFSSFWEDRYFRSMVVMETGRPTRRNLRGARYVATVEVGSSFVEFYVR